MGGWGSRDAWGRGVPVAGGGGAPGQESVACDEAIRQALGRQGAAASYSAMHYGQLVKGSTGSHESAVESCPCGHRTN